jgi:two-component system LytT family response regulator
MQTEILIIPDSKKLISIPINEILKLESSGPNTIIYWKNKEILYTQHLKLVLSKLDPNLFIRIHKSHAVNRREIRFYEKGRGGAVILSDGSSVPVAQRMKAAFLKQFYVK